MQDLEKRIETMTFENQTLAESKPSETRGGLLFLQKQEAADHPEAEDSPREFYNQTRKKPPMKKSPLPSRPQPITQSLRGLNNVTRTLYDPNAPAPKTPPVAVIQPINTVKVALVPPSPAPCSAASAMSPNSPVQMPEFHQQ